MAAEPVELEIFEYRRKVSVEPSPEFKKKELADYTLDTGLLCGHHCIYCSTPTINRTHPVFRQGLGISAFKAFSKGIAIPDPDTPNRIAAKAGKLTTSDTVLFCAKVDGWSPECQQLDLGRQCMETLLKANSSCQVRVLTKNVAVIDDLKYFTDYKDRIILSLSITAPRSKSDLGSIIEPNASSSAERLDVLKEATAQGFRIYGMVCPCLPGLLTDESDIEEVLAELLPLKPEAIWFEPVNPRGPGLKLTAAAFRNHDQIELADKVDKIRKREAHDYYTLDLITTINKLAKKYNCSDFIKILIYNRIKGNVPENSHVIWLGYHDKVPPAVTEQQADEALVVQASQTLSRIISEYFERAMLKAGEYIIRTFYDNDYESARNRKPAKAESLRQLIIRLQGEPGAPQKSWLYNAVKIAIDAKDFSSFHTYGNLQLSHKVALLPVGDTERKKTLIEQTVSESLTVRQLKERVASLKDQGGKPKPPRAAQKSLDQVLSSPDVLFSEDFRPMLELDALSRKHINTLNKLTDQVDKKLVELDAEMKKLQDVTDKYRGLLQIISSAKAKKGITP